MGRFNYGDNKNKLNYLDNNKIKASPISSTKSRFNLSEEKNKNIIVHFGDKRKISGYEERNPIEKNNKTVDETIYKDDIISENADTVDKCLFHLEKIQKALLRSPIFFNIATDIQKIIVGLKNPMQIMFMGEYNTGKSTFINALMKKNVVSVNCIATTSIITKLRYGIDDKLIIHYLDGTQKEEDINHFINYTVENKAHHELQADISYVERYMPNDFLKKITIIDSPGLESGIQKHTDVTKMFMSQADSAIWMFDFNQVESATNIKAMSELNPRLLSIAIVNKMDEFNEDEEDPEEFLKKIKEKFKDKVKKVIGVSALLALEGYLNNDADDIEASNIEEFYNYISDEIKPHIDEYKITTFIDQLCDFLIDNYETLKIVHDSLMKLKKEGFIEFDDSRNIINDIINSIHDLVNESINIFNDNTYINIYTRKTFKAIGIYYKIITSENENINSIGILEEAANNNNIYAQKIVLSYYMENQLIEKIKDLAEKLVQNDDSGIGEIILYNLYFSGSGAEKNLEKAIELLKKAAKKSKEGKFYLGRHYIYNSETGTDVKKGIDLLEKAAADGSSDALFELANMYYNGNLIEKDFDKTKKYIRKAADMGNVDAQFAIANMFFDGEIVEKDYKQAFKWFAYAAVQGSKDAQFSLGMCYENGLGVEQDLRAAFKWVKESAKDNETKFLKVLACYYLNGIGTISNFKLGTEILKKIAKDGDSEIQGILANLYIGKKQDEEAFYWAKMAAESNDPKGQFILGVMYYNGWYVEENKDIGLLWLKKSVDNDFEDAIDWIKKNSIDGLKFIIDYYNKKGDELSLIKGYQCKLQYSIWQKRMQSDYWMDDAYNIPLKHEIPFMDNEKLNRLIGMEVFPSEFQSLYIDFKINAENNILAQYGMLFANEFDLYEEYDNYNPNLNHDKWAKKLGNDYKAKFDILFPKDSCWDTGNIKKFIKEKMLNNNSD